MGKRCLDCAGKGTLLVKAGLVDALEWLTALGAFDPALEPREEPR
jgi:hypothetical protein